MVILEVEHLKKTYTTRLGSNRVEALRDVNFNVEQGEFVAIMGESGSGKTTLLNLLAALDKPTGGQIRLNGKNLGDLKEKEIAAFRRENLGFVFQDFNLLDTFSLKDNIFLPLVLEGKHYREMKQKADPIVKKLGISNLLEKYPYELSGGQRQRVAIARALLAKPDLIVADEPIASLDVSIQAQMVNLFRKLQKEQGFSFLFIAHDLSMVKFLCDRTGVMYRGRLVEEGTTKDVFSHPEHEYTKALLAAIPVPDPREERNRRVMKYNEG